MCTLIYLSHREVYGVKGWLLWILAYIGVLKRDNREESGYTGYYAFPGLFTFLVSFVDEADFALDVLLGVRLINAEEYVWGVLLVCFCTYAQIAIIARKKATNFKQSESNYETFFLFEWIIFMLEDSTSVVAFTQVAGLYDENSTLDFVIVVLTLVSAVVTTVLTVVSSFNESFSDGLFMFLLVSTPVAWICYIGIEFVILGNTASGEINTAILVLYGIFTVLGCCAARLSIDEVCGCQNCVCTE